MSAQAAKVLRRDLRRAVGAEAIGVIDHNAKLLASVQQEVAAHAQRLTNSQQQHETHWETRNDLAALQTVVVALRAELDGHVAWHHEQAARSFWQRLRWLVTGR